MDRCRRLARKFDVALKSVEWKENLEDEHSVFTLVVNIESDSAEIQLAESELRAYCAGKTTQGTDAKLESALNKRY